MQLKFASRVSASVPISTVDIATPKMRLAVQFIGKLCHTTFSKLQVLLDNISYK